MDNILGSFNFDAVIIIFILRRWKFILHKDKTLEWTGSPRTKSRIYVWRTSADENRSGQMQLFDDMGWRER